jgi:translocator protein
MTRRSWLGLGAWLVVCYGVAAVAGQFTPGAWYEQLAMPDWTPPDWLFGPVWTVLYGLMAVAAWMIWQQKGLSGASFALGLFGFQLALNLAWSWLFFGLQEIGLALADIVALWAAILLTIVAFWRENRVAGGLLMPYLLWVTFAAALNFEIWRLN